MTDYAEGDRVQVYDPDEEKWFDGKVAQLGGASEAEMTLGEPYMMVETDAATAFHLPLTIGVPESRIKFWVRRL